MLERSRWLRKKTIDAYSNNDAYGVLYERRNFNLTNDMFGASKMRAIQINEQPMYYVGDFTSNWKLSSFFH